MKNKYNANISLKIRYIENRLCFAGWTERVEITWQNGLASTESWRNVRKGGEDKQAPGTRSAFERCGLQSIIKGVNATWRATKR